MPGYISIGNDNGDRELIMKAEKGATLCGFLDAAEIGNSEVEEWFDLKSWVESGCEMEDEEDLDYGKADTAGENDDVVRIMTIHKSKGLEFPIVFVSGLGKGFNTQELKSDLVIHSDLGLGLVEKTKSPRTKRPSLVRNEIESRIKREDSGEELRVLYVALTRAKEKIILTGGISNAKKVFEKYRGNVNKGQPISFGQRESAGCYLDWIIPAMLSYPDKYTVSTVDATEFATRRAVDMASNDISKAALADRISKVSREMAFVYGMSGNYTENGSRL